MYVIACIMMPTNNDAIKILQNMLDFRWIYFIISLSYAHPTILKKKVRLHSLDGK